MKFSFDKFMNDIVTREETSKSVTNRTQRVQNDPAREYNKLYREHWQNSTYFSNEGSEKSRWKK